MKILLGSKSFVIFLLIILSACQQEKGAQKSSAKGIVIKTKNEKISSKEFEKRFKEDNPQLSETSEDEYYINALKKEYAYKLADELILKKLIEETDTKASEEDILKEIEGIKEGYTEEGFDEILKREGITLDSLKESVGARLALRKALNEKAYNDVKVSDGEIEEYYNKFKSSFYKSEEYEIDQITFQDEQKAREVYEKLKAGGLSFSAAKDKFSQSTEMLIGKEMGYIPKSGLPEEFEKALADLKPGDITYVIHTTYGNHILKLENKTEGHTQPLDEVKEEIRRRLIESKEKRAYGIFMEKLRQEEKVVINDDYFEAK